MKINFDHYDLTDNFSIKEGVFCGIASKLIVPNNIATKFSQQTKIFRSSIWDLTGILLSASYQKFVNYGENPENFPVPKSIDGCSLLQKVDGSANIIDYVNGQLSMRTRGTFSYGNMENYKDFEYCLNKYPAITKWLKENDNYSLITEITTPNLRIVINYGDEPDLWLTGAINKDDYSLMTQDELDNLAKTLGMKRPERYDFDNLENMLAVVDKWIKKEGLCLYSPNGQEIWKVKSEDYKIRHRLKEEFGSIEKIIDFFIQEKCPDYVTFMSRISEVVDFETATECRGDASKIIDAYKQVVNIMDGMNKFVTETLKPLPTRKDQALKVIASYSTTNRAAMIFKLLDGKSLNQDDIKKLLYQCLK